MSHFKAKPKRLSRTPAWSKGMRKLGPGVYVTEDRQIHVSEGEICEHFGVPYTRENQQIIEQVAQELIRKEFGEVPTTIVGEEAPE